MNNAKLIYAATLGLALVSTWAMADDTAAARTVPAAAELRSEARAEPARATDSAPRQVQADAAAMLPLWVSSVSQWRVREEARAAVRRGNRREADDGRF